MALGPDQTLPVGSIEEKDISYIEYIIDNHIRKTEGNRVVIFGGDLPLGWRKYLSKISSIYQKAGWYQVCTNGYDIILYH